MSSKLTSFNIAKSIVVNVCMHQSATDKACDQHERFQRAPPQHLASSNQCVLSTVPGNNSKEKMGLSLLTLEHPKRNFQLAHLLIPTLWTARLDWPRSNRPTTP